MFCFLVFGACDVYFYRTNRTAIFKSRKIYTSVVYRSLSMIKYQPTRKTTFSFIAAPELRCSRRRRHVCFADVSLGWGCICACCQQLSVSVIIRTHAACSIPFSFWVLEVTNLGFSKLRLGLILDFWNVDMMLTCTRKEYLKVWYVFFFSSKLD